MLINIKVFCRLIPSYIVLFYYDMHIKTALQINIIHLLVTMNRKIKKTGETKFFMVTIRQQIKLVLQHFFFSIRVFLHGHWQLTGQQGKGGDLFLFHSTTSTCSWTFRHLCANLHVRWLSHIFNCNTCIYQTATRWDLPPYRITIWLIDDVLLI